VVAESIVYIRMKMEKLTGCEGYINCSGDGGGGGGYHYHPYIIYYSLIDKGKDEIHLHD